MHREEKVALLYLRIRFLLIYASLNRNTSRITTGERLLELHTGTENGSLE